MNRDDSRWYGLWSSNLAGRRSAELVLRFGLYLVTPLVLALLFGQVHALDEFGHAYLGAFIVGGCIVGAFELLHRVFWPALVRHRLPWTSRLVAHALTILVAVGAGGWVASRIGALVLGWHDALFQLWIQGAVIACVVIPVLVALDEMVERERELERREAAHRLAALRAELSALQARTDPHFLFNSLNTVAALIPEDPVLAEKLVERLAAVFRFALDAGRRETVGLAEEIEAVTAYLEVEGLRLGPRLSLRLDRDQGLDAIRVPPWVLQPLVENAIKHGAGGRRGATELSVSVRRRGDELVLGVEDRPAAAGETSVAVRGGAGTALADLRSRLHLAYAGKARLEAGAAAPAGWRAEVSVPMDRGS